MNEHIENKEDDIIVQIAQRPDLTQRELASGAGISLGMTNIILKRLVTAGFIKMRRLSRRNIEYVLTPEGFARYTKRSYDYLVRTVSSVRGLKARIREIALEQLDNGAAGLAIMGEGELADIAELALRDIEAERNIKWTRGDAPEGWIRLVCDSEEDLANGNGGRGAQAMHPGYLSLGEAIAEGSI